MGTATVTGVIHCLAAPAGDPTGGDARLIGSGGVSRRRSAFDFGHPARRVTDVILVLNCLIYGAQWLSRDSLTMLGAKINHLIWAGQYWRLLTPVFLHGSVLHLAINTYSLNALGPTVELAHGHPRFIAIYTVSTLFSTVSSVFGTPKTSLGASGAIVGLGAALGIFLWRNRKVLGEPSKVMLKNLGLSLLINSAVWAAGGPGRFDNWGHLGGLVGGAVAALVVGNPSLERPNMPGSPAKA